MSIYGPTDDGDKRRWQQQGLIGLTRLIELGHGKQLPPLAWTLPAGSRVLGRVEPLGDHAPRDVYDQWYSALLGELGPPVKEWPGYTSATGKTSLIAHFRLRLTERELPAVEVALTAEWFAEDLVQAVEK